MKDSTYSELSNDFSFCVLNIFVSLQIVYFGVEVLFVKNFSDL